jgi:hypothetical protein
MNTPDPTISSNGVWLPLPLANALFLCYYGSGPRHPSSIGRESPPPAEDEAPEIPPPTVTEDGDLKFKLSNTIREWTPRGYAASRGGVQSPEGHPPPEPEP